MDLAALVLSMLLVIQIGFQAKLAAGAPLGHIAYGGMHPGVLPKRYRITSGFAVVLYLFFLSVVLAYAFDLNTYSEGFTRAVLWIMVVFFVLGTIANLASRSKSERWWALYTIASVVCVLIMLNS